MLALFSFSLFRPPSIVEQMTRLKEPDFPTAAVSYTRKVTMVWCGFFAFNGAVALYTVLQTDMDLWAIYNGFISYCLMGLLFAGEYIYTIVDSNASTCPPIVDTIIIQEPDELIIQGSLAHVLCKGDNTGEIHLTITGGIAPYEYSIELL